MTLPDLRFYLLSVTAYSTILPGALICLLPVLKWIKFSPKRLFPPAFFIYAVLLFLILPFVDCQTNLNKNKLFFPLLALSCAVYFLVINLEVSKLLYLFLSAMAALSFGGLANHMTEAIVAHSFSLSGLGLVVQWAVSLLFVFFFLSFKKQTIWIFENFHNKTFWHIVWCIPAIICFCNIMMIPQNPSIMFEGRLIELYFLIEAALLFLFLAFQFFLLQLAKVTTQKYEIEKRIQLFEAQSHQYRSLQAYMEQTRRMRHDFRHAILVISQLAADGEYEELRRYTSNYQKSCDSIFAPHRTFCSHTSLNALLGYYAEQANQDGIPLDWKINLPSDLPLTDVDLSVIFGNLLENALQACLDVPVSDRYINLSADMNSPGCLYVVMVNSFNGKLKKQKNRLLSTKADGSGIGLVSVTATVEKYQGTTQFYAENREFYSNVMVRLDSPSPSAANSSTIP